MFHQLVEREGVRRAVYSRGDLDYLQRRGWEPVVLKVAAVLQPKKDEDAPAKVKRKYTRRAP